MRTHRACYISGGICGSMWWPIGRVGGKLVTRDARGHWGFWQKGDSFRDALDSLLMKEGGDFMGAQFTADTVFRIEQREPAAKGYRVRVWERDVASLPDCADLVSEHWTGDFMGDD